MRILSILVKSKYSSVPKKRIASATASGRARCIAQFRLELIYSALDFDIEPQQLKCSTLEQLED